MAQKPSPFASTIYENVAYCARIHVLMRNRAELDDHVEACLERARLWDEVKDDLHRNSGHDLYSGQQQRLCIARVLSTKPDVLLTDEPKGSIDPVATAKIEDLIQSLRQDHAVVIVTHSMMQARGIAYFHLGELRKVASTEMMCTAARDKDAAAFIAGVFG